MTEYTLTPFILLTGECPARTFKGEIPSRVIR